MARRIIITVATLLGVLFTMSLLLIFFAPYYLKKKITQAINTRTDYQIHIGDLSLGINSLLISGIELEPKLKPEAYFKKLGYQADWIKADIDVLKIHGISWKRLLLDGEFDVEGTVVKGADVYVYRDKRFPHDGKYKPLPSTLLRESDLVFTIPKVNTSDCHITYEEMGPNSDQPLVVTFNKLEAEFLHFSSDKAYMQKYPQVSIEARAYVFDTIETRISYVAQVFDTMDTYQLSGNMNSFPATLLNQTEPVTGIGIESGQVHAIHFSFTGNEHASHGKMNIRHENLRLKISEEKENSRLKTFIANLLIYNDNPGRNGRRGGEIHFKRNKSRFIFNYWWNSFKTGVLSSIQKTDLNISSSGKK